MSLSMCSLCSYKLAIMIIIIVSFLQNNIIVFGVYVQVYVQVYTCI